MRCGVSVVAAVWAAALGCACPGQTKAGDLTVGADKILFFSGVDLWRNGAFTHAGGLWSPQGIDNEGFALKLSAGAGTYRYRSDALSSDITGHALSFSLLPGWRFKRDGFVVTGFAGLEIQRHDFSPDDTENTLRGTSVGVRGALELWYEPTSTSMISADVSATSIGPSYSARAAAGWRISDSFYIGPEIAGFAFDDSYRQLRLGAHVTAFKTGAFEWSAGAGWSRDSDHREGIYGRLGLLRRFGLSPF